MNSCQSMVILSLRGQSCWLSLKSFIDKLQFPNLKLKVKDTHQSKAGLFVYDIFWVFFTPVMVSVAKSFDAPIKLLFPTADSARPFSMLGLGDIVIPAERRVVPGSCGEEFKFASFMAVTLSCDHRVIDVIYQGY